jgi:microcystin-dependent protein
MIQTCKYPRVGMVFAWAGTNIPDGSFWCDGSYKNKLDYPVLFSIIGDRYNDANTPANSFKLPDFRNKFLFGENATNTALSATITGNWQIQEFKHQHTVDVNALSAINTARGYMESGSEGAAYFFGNDTRTLTIGANTTDTKVDFIPPYTIISYIIYHD